MVQGPAITVPFHKISLRIIRVDLKDGNSIRLSQIHSSRIHIRLSSFDICFGIFRIEFNCCCKFSYRTVSIPFSVKGHSRFDMIL